MMSRQYHIDVDDNASWLIGHYFKGVCLLGGLNGSLQYTLIPVSQFHLKYMLHHNVKLLRKP